MQICRCPRGSWRSNALEVHSVFGNPIRVGFARYADRTRACLRDLQNAGLARKIVGVIHLRGPR